MAELQGPAFFKFFTAVEKTARTECATFWADGFWADEFWEEGFWEDCGIAEPEVVVRVNADGGAAGWRSRQDHKDKRNREIMRDDEELMAILQVAMPEILKYLKL